MSEAMPEALTKAFPEDLAEAFLKAFFKTFDEGGSDLHAALSGSLYGMEAPRGICVPYAVISVPFDRVAYETFTSTSYEAQVQVDIYAASPNKCSDLAGKVKRFMQEIPFAVEGFDYVHATYDGTNRIRAKYAYHYTVEYRVLLHKN